MSFEFADFFTLANMLGLAGAVFFIATLAMKTMIPLRIAGIVSNFFFLCNGILSYSIPSCVLYAVLLPVNAIRLYQMHRLIQRVKTATRGDQTMDWLKPFMTKRNYYQGDTIFKAGDSAIEMFFAVTGKYLVKEINIELPPGRIFGELAFIAVDKCRTQTVECIESGHVLTISYDKVRELYFQNPEFGYYFLQLISERLMQNNARLEGIVAELKGLRPA